MRGKQLSKDRVYAIMLSVFTTGNYNETAKQLNLPFSTVKTIYDRNKNKPEFAKLREKKENEFINRADRIIQKAMDRLEKSLDNKKEKIPVNNLSTVIGTLYDKKALAKGEPTANETITINIGLSDEH